MKIIIKNIETKDEMSKILFDFLRRNEIEWEVIKGVKVDAKICGMDAKVNSKLFYSTKQTAGILNIKTGTLKMWKARGKIAPSMCIGNRPRYKGAEIKKLMKTL